jgi:HD-like signal output (HDOD) protein
MLAQQWALPESLVHAVRYHHQPDQQSAHASLAAIVYVADLLLSRFHAGVELERLDTRKLAAHMASIDLRLDHFTDLVDLIPKEVFDSGPDSTRAGKQGEQA